MNQPQTMPLEDRIRKEKHAEAQRVYNKAQRLLGATTIFPPLTFPAFRETSGEVSQFSVWRDNTRRELQ